MNEDPILSALEEAIGHWDAYVEHTTEGIMHVRDTAEDAAIVEQAEQRLADLDVERKRITELCMMIVGVRERRLS